MTVLCGGGVSGPKAGVAETIIFTTSALASVLNNKGGAWATLVAPLLGVLAYQATELCEVDPPADPGLTADDYLHLLRLDDFGAVAAATAKLADLVKIAIWYEVCECKSVATPAVDPGLLAPPDGVGSPQPVTLTPCWSTTQIITPVAFSGGGTIGPSWYHLGLLPPAPTVTIDRNSPHQDHQAKVVDPSWKSISLRVKVDTGGPDTTIWTGEIDTFNSLGPGNGTMNIVEVDSNDFPNRPYEKVVTQDIPAGILYLAPAVLQQPGGTPYPVEVQLDLYCGAAGGTVLEPCGPDPGTLALLQQIYELLRVVQRQHVPFSYVPGLEYAGRSGDGEITFSDPIVRLQVVLTTLPPHYGMAEGSPDAIFDVGFVSLGTADGFERSHRITTSPFLLHVPSDVTKIGHSLAPGVVATIRTYSREP